MHARDRSDVERALDQQYGVAQLGERIRRALQESGKDLSTLTRDDIATVDEFHMQGQAATRELAQLAGLGPGTEVLDVGCGVGGPARTLALEFGCRVTGVDVVDEYCRAAALLSSWVDLDDDTRFVRASALDLPLREEQFDAVMVQHVSMNLDNKQRALAEMRRVLQPDGRLLLYEVLAGPAGEPPHFPVPWADEPDISFLISPEEMKQLLAEVGFSPETWEDVTEDCLAWFEAVAAQAAERPSDASPPLGLNLLMGESTREKSRNVIRNLQEERIAVVQALCVR